MNPVQPRAVHASGEGQGDRLRDIFVKRMAKAILSADLTKVREVA